MAVRLPNGWDPRSYQLPAWQALEGGKRRGVMVWHRRAGKDSFGINYTACESQLRPGVYWHLAPTQKQVRKIIWDNVDGQGRRVIDQAWPEEIRKGTNGHEMKIELKNGSIWQCVGSDNYDSLVGANPLGVVFSEYSGQSLLAGILVLAIMILPTVALLSEASLRSVPEGHLRAAAALGLSRWATVRGVALPTARGGILAAVLLALARAIGETMALLMVTGNVVQTPRSPFDPVRTLTANIALELGYAMDHHRSALFVSGLALMALVVVLVLVTEWAGRRWNHA